MARSKKAGSGDQSRAQTAGTYNLQHDRTCKVGIWHLSVLQSASKCLFISPLVLVKPTRHSIILRTSLFTIRQPVECAATPCRRTGPRDCHERLRLRCMRRLYDDNLALYGKRYFYYVWELPVFVLMGVTAGLLGALFIKLNIRMTQLRARFIPPSKPRLRLMEVLAASPFCNFALCIVNLPMRQ